MPTLSHVINIYLQVDRSYYTNRCYAATLRRLSAVLGGERDVREISFTDLLTFINQIKPTLKQISLAKYAAEIRCFFGWCVEIGVIPISPAVNLRVRRPPRDRKSRAVPPSDLQKLLDHVKGNARDYALVMFLADTGCRVGGIASLRIENLDLIENCAILHEKSDKIHLAWFGDETAAALRAWLKVRPKCDHDYVFVALKGPSKGNALPRETITILVRRASEKACGKVYSPHRIRHSVGHGWARKGVPVTVVQRKLGHKRPNITYEFYFPDTDEEVKSTSRELALVSLGDRPKPIARGKIIRLADYG